MDKIRKRRDSTTRTVEYEVTPEGAEMDVDLQLRYAPPRVIRPDAVTVRIVTEEHVNLGEPVYRVLVRGHVLKVDGKPGKRRDGAYFRLDRHRTVMPDWVRDLLRFV